MGHKIFLSHNHADKPVVEPVALRLAGIFGESAVFYDSWSIRPGDGIIDQMNKGLEAPEFVFFFVSEKSLASQMVKLEWQNALFSASRGKTRIIPVRVDGSSMPPILTQTLYIDMYSAGLEAAIAQIVNVTQGNGSFAPQHGEFSNLSYSIELDGDESVIIRVSASHFMEPNGSFLIETTNNESDFSCESVNGTPFFGGYQINSPSDITGTTIHSFHYKTMGGAITPTHPLQIRIRFLTKTRVNIVGFRHEAAQNQWKQLPFKS